jgi:hypothetical protein
MRSALTAWFYACFPDELEKTKGRTALLAESRTPTDATVLPSFATGAAAFDALAVLASRASWVDGSSAQAWNAAVGGRRQPRLSREEWGGPFLSGGLFVSGTQEEDRPVTREVRVFP